MPPINPSQRNQPVQQVKAISLLADLQLLFSSFLFLKKKNFFSAEESKQLDSLILKSRRL